MPLRKIDATILFYYFQNPICWESIIYNHGDVALNTWVLGWAFIGVMLRAQSQKLVNIETHIKHIAASNFVSLYKVFGNYSHVSYCFPLTTNCKSAANCKITWSIIGGCHMQR